jgi:hypothetical protein
MRKLCLVFLLCFLFSGCGAATKKSVSGENYYGPYKTRADFLHAIERGDADADEFVEAVNKGSLKLTDVSPEALANYFEAFANEGMLYQTPTKYLTNEEIKTSLARRGYRSLAR